MNGLPTGAAVFEDDIESVLLTEEQVQGKVRDLAAQISKDYRGRDVLLVGVLKGAFILMADLARALTVPHEFDFMAVSSYGSATQTSGVVRILKDLDREIEGKYAGFDIPSVFVVGYGLDYAERYRNLPFVATLKPEVYRDR